MYLPKCYSMFAHVCVQACDPPDKFCTHPWFTEQYNMYRLDPDLLFYLEISSIGLNTVYSTPMA